ncbi:CMRF35-like molecule 8 isoform X2 [Xyrichtys novacula]|uniref:CMRF35-like molecule 8 isoform X2 n=1 Tax=Xyrichtys novacula TaxID=13765 RepID=A0AAV1EXG3_XYRNO|nr:CMRF35-like molecule 8 isoform X2 [Xyrichtys novacula]
MGISLTVVICLLTGSLSLQCASGNKGDNTPLNLTAYQGGLVTIHCKYPKAEGSSIQRFCKEDVKLDCLELISTHNAPITEKERYSLTYDKQHGVFNVTISQVALEDAGRYRCEVQKDSTTVYLTEINLQVINWDDIPTKTPSSDSGKNVKIDCPYPETHANNNKFLCKGQNPFSCDKLIQTTEEDRYVENGRFKIRDSSRQNYFYVYIRNLSSADSGVYWCGSDPTWQQTEFNKFLLSPEFLLGPGSGDTGKHIKSGLPRDATQEDQQPIQPEVKSSLEGLIGGIAGFLVLSLILVVVIVLFRNKIPRTQVCCGASGPSEQIRNTGQNSEGNHEEPQYEEIQEQKTSLGDTAQAVYTTVDLPTDQLHYTTISAHKDRVSDSTDEATLPDTNKMAARQTSPVVIYSPAVDQIVYSTVSMPGEQ